MCAHVCVYVLLSYMASGSFCTSSHHHWQKYFPFNTLYIHSPSFNTEIQAFHNLQLFFLPPSTSVLSAPILSSYSLHSSPLQSISFCNLCIASFSSHRFVAAFSAVVLFFFCFLRAQSEYRSLAVPVWVPKMSESSNRIQKLSGVVQNGFP